MEIEIRKAEDIFNFLKKYRKSTRYQFRGQSNSEWSLVPKAGRAPYNNIDDKEIFKHWKRRAYLYIENKNLSDIELLTIAQHTGLPTRLLDCTYNPLVAFFFACIENFDVDGAVYSYNSPKKYVATSEIIDPFNEDSGVKMLQPISIHSRLSNQFGYFTLHNHPSNELICNNTISKIIIPKELKEELLFIINQLGINNMTIYPDLEGLSKHLSWFYENYNYWTETKSPSSPYG